MKGVTPDDIKKLKQNEIFVFGSNEAGKHGAGAAVIAKEKFGAREGQGFGPFGDTFAIPTKEWSVSSPLPLAVIECYAVRFCEYAALRPEKTFLVTQLGCGLAGYTPKDIAPFFVMASEHSNIHLPQSFWDVLDNNDKEDMYDSLKIEDDGQKNELRHVP